MGTHFALTYHIILKNIQNINYFQNIGKISIGAATLEVGNQRHKE